MAVAAAAAAFAGAAEARPIVAVSKDDRGIYVLDLGTVEVSDAGRFVWTYGIYDVDRPISYMAMRQEVDCKAQRIRYVEIEGFDAEGRSLGRSEEKGDWSPRARHGQVMIVDAACKADHGEAGKLEARPFDMELPEFVRFYRGTVKRK